MYNCNLTLLEQKKWCSVSVSAKCFSCSSFVDHDETQSDFEGPEASTTAGCCCLRLYCQADAEFIALFFLLQLVTIMGKLSQVEWINLKKCSHSHLFCFGVEQQVGVWLHPAPPAFLSPPLPASGLRCPLVCWGQTVKHDFKFLHCGQRGRCRSLCFSGTDQFHQPRRVYSRVMNHQATKPNLAV